MSLADLRKLVLKSIKGSECIFDNLCIQFEESLSNEKSHTLADLHLLSNVRKGRLFERLCLQYLKHILGFTEVYLLSEIPSDLRQLLRLPLNDFGIDIVAIARDEGGISETWAVQCKYRKHYPLSTIITSNGSRVRTNVVSWQELATFYGLCSKTGPWSKLLVMTSAEGVNRRVAMQPNDMSICLGRWRSLTSSQWYRMIECEERTISDGVNPPTDQLRQLRLNFFDRN